MNEKVKFTVEEIAGGVWNINESEGNGAPFVDAYLVCGSERALLIDTLIGECGLLEKIKEITSLPVEVVITHGHRDHAGFETANLAKAGYKIYMDMADLNVLNGSSAVKWDESIFTPLHDGMEFDLGGRVLEVISLPGHTPGSAVLLDRKNQLLFSGDSIGSGMFWMQLPHALPLAQFQAELKRFKEKLAGLDQIVIFPGHRHQSPVTLTKHYIEDVDKATEMLLAGELVGGKITGPTALRFPGSKAANGLVTEYCYDPARLR